MMGNLYEWTESPYNDTAYGSASNRAARGGGFASYGSYYLGTSGRSHQNPADEYHHIGFRVASEIPEPATIMILLAGIFGLRKTKK